eukprot:9473390-Pyramimonas_sp.AAC.1
MYPSGVRPRRCPSSSLRHSVPSLILATHARAYLHGRLAASADCDCTCALLQPGAARWAARRRPSPRQRRKRLGPRHRQSVVPGA